MKASQRNRNQRIAKRTAELEAKGIEKPKARMQAIEENNPQDSPGARRYVEQHFDRALELKAAGMSLQDASAQAYEEITRQPAPSRTIEDRTACDGIIAARIDADGIRVWTQEIADAAAPLDIEAETALINRMEDEQRIPSPADEGARAARQDALPLGDGTVGERIQDLVSQGYTAEDARTQALEEHMVDTTPAPDDDEAPLRGSDPMSNPSPLTVHTEVADLVDQALAMATGIVEELLQNHHSMPSRTLAARANETVGACMGITAAIDRLRNTVLGCQAIAENMARRSN